MLLAILVPLFTLQATPAPAHAAVRNLTTKAGDPALNQLRSCIAERRRLLVVLLLDESGSLKSSDPDDRRVDAAKVALGALVDVTQSDGENPPQVQVLLAGFSGDFADRSSGWRILDDRSLPDLLERVAQFGDRDGGGHTNYVKALRGAQHFLADQAGRVSAQDGPIPCKALVWLTDGELDPGSDAERNHDAHVLCDSGGVADQLRRAHVTVIAIALTKLVTSADLDFLRRLATGREAGCGAIQGPGFGAYLETGDWAELIDLFDGAFSQFFPEHAGGDPTPGRTCPGTPCPAGTTTFDLTGPLRLFRVLAQIDERGQGQPAEVLLTAPRGLGELRMRPATQTGSVTMAGIRLTYRWIARNILTVRGELPSGSRAWVGRWSVSFVEPTGTGAGAATRLHVHLYGDLEPKLIGRPRFIQGQPWRFTVQVVNGAGTPPTPETLGSLAVSVNVAPDTGAELASRGAIPVPLTRSDVQRYSGTLDPSPDWRGDVLLLVTLRLTTRDGVALSDFTKPFPVAVKPPAGFPQVTPDRVQAPRIDGEGTSSVRIRVSGATGAGCVWLDHATLQRHLSLPSTVQSVRVTVDPDATSTRSCLRVAARGDAELRVTFAPKGTADEPVEGVLPFRLTSASQPGERTDEIGFAFEMSRPLDEGVRWRSFLAGLALAALILLVLLVLVKRVLLARFRLPGATDATIAASVPVMVRGLLASGDNAAQAEPPHLERRDRIDARSDFWLDLRQPEGDFKRLPPGRAGAHGRMARHVTVGGLHLRVRTPLRPFALPHGVVAGRAVVAGRLGGRVEAPGRIPLTLRGLWVLLVKRNDLRNAFEQDSDGRARTTTPQRVADLRGDLIVFPDRPEPDLTTMVARLRVAVPEGALRLLASEPGRTARGWSRWRRRRATPDQDRVESGRPDPPPDDQSPATGVGAPGLVDDDPLADDLLAGDPVGAPLDDPLAGDPLAGDPLDADPSFPAYAAESDTTEEKGD